MSAMWYATNDHVIRVKNLKNAQTGLYINSGAIVQITRIEDKAGATVTGVSYPVALSPVAGTTSGEWTASIGAGLAVTLGQNYDMILEMNPAGSPKAFMRLPFAVWQRT